MKEEGTEKGAPAPGAGKKARGALEPPGGWTPAKKAAAVALGAAICVSGFCAGLADGIAEAAAAHPAAEAAAGGPGA